MKILSVYLNNYIGIYNGLGLDTIYIDFRKSKNKKTIIKGKNGSGKSTLFNALHPLPDSNDNFINGKPAEKVLEILDNDILYKIKIIHGVNKHGDRETTKAYITKITDIKEELNPNGNVTSFKEILYDEFNLEANFVALSKLSTEDRGLVDKKPVDRKKFVNSIVDCLEVYNNIYKVLSKRSSIFKSMMNNLISKIDNIGDEDKLKVTLESLENRITNNLNSKDDIIQELASYKSKIQLIDPDGSIQFSYNEIYNNIVSINIEIDRIVNKTSSVISKLNLPDNNEETISTFYKNTVSLSNDLEIGIRVYENKINTLLSSREDEVRSIESKNIKLQSLTSEFNYKELKSIISETKNTIQKYSDMIQTIGIKDIYNISKDEFIIGLDTLKEVKETIDIFRDTYDYNTLNIAIEYVKTNTYPDINKMRETLSEYISLKDKLSIEYSEYQLLEKISSKLSLRPSKCNIDNCEFIKDAVLANSKNPIDNSIRLSNELRILEDNSSKLKSEIVITENIVDCINGIKTLLRNITKNINIINKLPVGDLFIDKNILLDEIPLGTKLDRIDTLYTYIGYANIIEDYKRNVEYLKTLESEYKIYETKSSIVDEIFLEIEELNKKLDSITYELETSKKELFDAKNKLLICKDKIVDFEVLLNLQHELKELNRRKSEDISRFNLIKSNMSQIRECSNNIDILTKKLNSINLEIKPLMSDRDKIVHGLSLLTEYKQELETFSLKYNKVEIIKKYSSPSKGIQTLFMELYMNKTVSLANQLLTLLFDGEYTLGQFVINENEFRIPCIGSGITNDDISSMSTSQRCMISMIISFVMLQQSSTKYNILRLDEIDGGLDTANRLNFLFILDKQIEMLNTEQVFIVSHNSEIDYSDCDIIQLKSIDNEISQGNIIYDVNSY